MRCWMPTHLHPHLLSLLAAGHCCRRKALLWWLECGDRLPGRGHQQHDFGAQPHTTALFHLGSCKENGLDC